MDNIHTITELMTSICPQIEIIHDQWDEYELLDSGRRRKLERFGQHILVRSEPKAWWEPDLPPQQWAKAEAEFIREEKGEWVFHKPIDPEWTLKYENVVFRSKLSNNSHHVGVFPEHSQQWRWLQQRVKQAGRPLQILNLFGYTGAASLILASMGHPVTHVDASKVTVRWARTNQELSKMEDKPIRWIIDDAAKFVQREARRGKKYDAILLDPPSYGRGPKGELWKAEQHLVELLTACREVIGDEPDFILMTMYSIDESSVMIGNMLHDLMKNYGGTVSLGELALKHKHSPKMLPMSIFARWEK